MNTETILRDALHSGAGALDVPEDPWPAFTRRERTHRRNRRIRVAGVAVALAAALGVQTGVVPLPAGAPGIAVAGRPTALTSAPTRGNLAADAGFLAALRGEIKDIEDPGETWRITSRQKIKFVYAADVGGHRLALALVPLRFGFLTDAALVWYEGPAGAPAAEMTEGGRTDGGNTVVTWMDGYSDRTGLLVVVAPPAATVAVSSGFTYTAAGRVEHGKPVRSAGLAEVPLAASPMEPGVTVKVTDRGAILHDGPASGSWSGHGGDNQEPTDSMLTAALGNRTFDRELLRSWVSAAFLDARLPVAGASVRVGWTGTVNGQAAALVTVQPAGGGVLAYAFHGAADSYREDLRLLLPASGAAQRPIAWRMRAEGKDDRTDQVIVVAPPGATRVSLDGTALPLDATGAAVGSLPPNADATVTADFVDGTAPTSTPVPPFETDSGGLPGDTPRTRIVP
ncbi:hypothetical protein GCM10010172_70510 [Paractinoplanes ferrugineus]|uniref:Uncharacterized protein n=1 Tax=Paractinoplanes ferrugineus TaxID=113564 RepID=A0A919MLN9_9ACTN|nr:hypothetical protein [Actinoplanes ferrugineus]GIE12422.1 hypothetical protein Afe05nite_42620 [Actinoplanes ferrugineus]